jgi:hypothetical protein
MGGGRGAANSNAVKGNTLSCGHTPPESESAVECILSALGHQLHVNRVFHKTRSQSPARLPYRYYAHNQTHSRWVSQGVQ